MSTSGNAFAVYAPLFTANDEVGNALVSIGNGTTRGSQMIMNGQLVGWDVGQSSTNRSWQTNTVDTVYKDPGSTDDYLTFDFNRVADPVTGAIINPDEGIFSGEIRAAQPLSSIRLRATTSWRASTPP